MANSDNYLSVKAKDGDGIFSLLRRYSLEPNSCNQKSFESLNDLKRSKKLRVGSSYKLPIIIYTYNGKSIRSTIKNEDLELAKNIQAFNRLQVKNGLKTEAYEQSKVLWVPHELIHCTGAKPTAPSEFSGLEKASSDGYAIFGEKYKEVTAKSNNLSGDVFYLVAGHGGPDPGAIGKKNGNSLCEDEYAYDLVLRLAREIIAHGGTPYVIVRDPNDGIREEQYLDCDYDEITWGNKAIPKDQRDRLNQRTDIINALYRDNKSRSKSMNQYCIVVHVDSRHEKAQTDLFFYYQKDNKASTKMTKDLRNAVQNNYKRIGRSKAYEGRLLTRDLHMLRESEVPTVYIELGNIQHHFDQKRVLLPRNRQLLANWFTEGIIESLN